MSDVPRDRWGRPLIIPPDSPPDAKKIAYTRASSLGKTLTDHTTLTRWKQRQTALGLARRPDLLTSAAAHRDDNAELDRICEQAMEAVGSSAAAILGTAIHAITEVVDIGGIVEDVPPDVLARVTNYTETIRLARLVPEQAETFVVCDELTVAGTFDRLYRTPAGKTLIGDIKSGRLVDKTGRLYPSNLVEYSVQLAVYAHGQAYDPTTGRRTPLPDLDPSRGVIVHLPAHGTHCALIELDLTAGWTLAQLAAEVLQTRRLRNLAVERFRNPKETP